MISLVIYRGARNEGRIDYSVFDTDTSSEAALLIGWAVKGTLTVARLTVIKLPLFKVPSRSILHYTQRF